MERRFTKFRTFPVLKPVLTKQFPATISPELVTEELRYVSQLSSRPPSVLSRPGSPDSLPSPEIKMSLAELTLTLNALLACQQKLREDLYWTEHTHDTKAAIRQILKQVKDEAEDMIDLLHLFKAGIDREKAALTEITLVHQPVENTPREETSREESDPSVIWLHVMLSNTPVLITAEVSSLQVHNITLHPSTTSCSYTLPSLISFPLGSNWLSSLGMTVADGRVEIHLREETLVKVTLPSPGPKINIGKVMSSPPVIEGRAGVLGNFIFQKAITTVFSGSVDSGGNRTVVFYLMYIEAISTLGLIIEKNGEVWAFDELTHEREFRLLRCLGGTRGEAQPVTLGRSLEFRLLLSQFLAQVT